MLDSVEPTDNIGKVISATNVTNLYYIDNVTISPDHATTYFTEYVIINIIKIYQ